MLRSFVDWLDDYLADVGVGGLAAGCLGVLGFGGLLSALLGDGAVKAAAIVVVLLSILGFFLVVTASRMRWRARAIAVEAALQRAYDRQIAGDQYWTVKQWWQTIWIEPNGDSTLSVTVHGVSDLDSLSFFRIQFGAGWNQPPRYRGRVQAQVRSPQFEGVGGTRAEKFEHCRDDGQLQVYIEFPSPLPIGGEFRFVSELRWPGRCRPLMRDGRPDEFCVTAARAMDLLEYTVILPAEREFFYDPVGFAVGEVGLTLVSKTARDGRTEVVLRGEQLAEGRRVGMRLELK